MSYCVARMEKMKSDNLVGIGNHNQRRFSNHSNKDIDVSKSHLNYDILDKVKIRTAPPFTNFKSSSKI